MSPTSSAMFISPDLSLERISELLYKARSSYLPVSAQSSGATALASSLYACLDSEGSQRPLSLSSALGMADTSVWLGVADGRYALSEGDVRTLLGPFGPLRTAGDGVATFFSAADALRAFEALHGRVLSDGAYLQLLFFDGRPGGGLQDGQGHGHQGGQHGGHQSLGAGVGVRKFTCRFDILIPNDSHFAVARRLIGLRGQNMKRIVKLSGSDTKLRLRGRGSGFLEGIGKQESDEALHLCVSCKEFEGYRVAVRLVTELLEEIYGEYRVLMDKGLVPKRGNLQVVCIEQPLMYNTASAYAYAPVAFGAAQPPGAQPGAEAAGAGQPGAGAQPGASPPSESGEDGEEIQRLIEARNAARARLNFEEADRIRDVLKGKGIGLMDEPGGRGKAADVTSWRYWR